MKNNQKLAEKIPAVFNLGSQLRYLAPALLGDKIDPCPNTNINYLWLRRTPDITQQNVQNLKKPNKCVHDGLRERICS